MAAATPGAGTDVGEPRWETGPRYAITDVPGIRVGHWTDRRGVTGCTVIRCETAQAAAVDVRGGAPGTRETEVLHADNVVRNCHAIVLAGGSAFGLAAAGGVMRWLAEHDIGFPTTARKVPIVPAAVLFDLGIGKPEAFPDEAAGYQAASRAKGGAVEEGCVGAGMGATVAKLLGPDRAIKGGIGTASVAGPRGIIVGAIAVANAVGSVFDPDTGELVAGPREAGGGFVALADAVHRRRAAMEALLKQNTTLAVVATNAALDHHQLRRLAIQAHDGFARTISPVHTFADGDIAFAVTTGTLEVEPDDVLVTGMLASRAVEQAIVRGVRAAKGVASVPSAGEWLAR